MDGCQTSREASNDETLLSYDERRHAARGAYILQPRVFRVLFSKDSHNLRRRFTWGRLADVGAMPHTNTTP